MDINEDLDAKELVAQELPSLLQSLTKELRVLFGNQLDEVLKPAFDPDGVVPQSIQGDGIILHNAIENHSSIMNVLGLQLRLAPLQGAIMTTVGGGKIVPQTVYLDCKNPQKLLSFLQELIPEDLNNHNLYVALEGLGKQFFKQVAYGYSLDATFDQEIGLVSSLPAIASEFERLGLTSLGQQLLGCVSAIKEHYIREYSLLARQGIFENNIAVRYVDRNEPYWYESDWDKLLEALFEVQQNPKANEFLRVVRDDLIVKAKDALDLFDQWEPKTDGKLFAIIASKKLKSVIPILERLC